MAQKVWTLHKIDLDNVYDPQLVMVCNSLKALKEKIELWTTCEEDVIDISFYPDIKFDYNKLGSKHPKQNSFYIETRDGKSHHYEIDLPILNNGATFYQSFAVRDAKNENVDDTPKVFM